MYTNGLIAVREKYLLNDKILKLCDTTAEEAFRTLSENGFGKSAEVTSVYNYEKLVAADEEDIDKFIREYAPTRAEAVYLLSSRDFHNAKAAVKARFLKSELDGMLAPEGLIPVQTILKCVEGGDFQPLGKELGGAVEEAFKLFEEDRASGAEIGIIFEKALYVYLNANCSKNGVLKKLLSVKADMTNILTAMRSAEEENARKCYLTGGKLSEKLLGNLFSDDKERAEAFKGTPYYDFVKKCISDRERNLPLTSAEKICDSFEAEFFTSKKYELVKTQPFLYYVFRRRVENANARILIACLLAGMGEIEIKNRMRTF